METKPVTAKRGLVAMFDILGYQAFLDASDASPEVVINRVLTTLNTIETEQDKVLASAFSNDFAGFKREFANWEWLVFSDTILLTFELPDDDVTRRRTKINLFLMQCAMLSRFMFDFGMPLRGAIEYGTFYTQNACFVGKPIVTAYRQSNLLQLASCVISPEIFSLYSHAGEDKEYVVKRTLAVSYLTPLRDGRMETLRLLVPWFRVENASWKSKELKQVVLEAFWAHNKQMDASASNKADNTEQFLRFLRMNYSDFN